MKKIHRMGCLVLALLLMMSLAACGTRDPLQKTAEYLLETTPSPQVGSIGGEWAVLGLARSGEKVPDSFYEAYMQNLLETLQAVDGVLSDRKYTEYSRVVLALTAMGQDPTDVGGYDLLAPLADLEMTTFQGLNGGIFALLALDSGSYTIPDVPQAATREDYVNYILSRKCEDGGWSLSGGPAEADLTAMALQALAKYQEDPQVQTAVDRGVAVLAQLQQPEGGYLSWGESSSESTAQVLVALCELGISPEDERFVSESGTLLEQLLQFQTGDGGFSHVLGGKTDRMATEQAFYAMAAVRRAEQGRSSLYRMAEEP